MRTCPEFGRHPRVHRAAVPSHGVRLGSRVRPESMMPLKGRPTNPRGRAAKVTGEQAVLYGKKRRGKSSKNKVVTDRRCVNCGQVIPLKMPYDDKGNGKHAHFVCP
jgi:hypothetical protein